MDKLVCIPLVRSTALIRAILWGAPAVVLGVTTIIIVARVDWRASPVSSPVIGYAIAALAFPVGVAALTTAILSIRWLLLSLWPGRLGLEADPEKLVIRLGPFGTRQYDARQLTIRYPFELSDEDGGGRFGEYEKFLPEEVQLRMLLPRISHASAAELLDHVLLRYLGVPEDQLAAALRPLVECWRPPTGNPVNEKSE